MAKDVSKYARYDPAFATDGLFVPRAKKGQALYDVGRSYDKGTVKFEGVQLTSAHQSVLLAICARTGRGGLKILGSNKDPQALQMRLALKEKDLAKDADTAIVKCSAYSLLVDAGMGESGNDYNRLADFLNQLASVSVYRRLGSKGGSSHLLSFEHDGDQMQIALNWRLASSILGEQNIQVSLSERHKLEGPIARILHAWVCCYVRQGGSYMNGQGGRLDTLAGHVWGKRPASDDTIRKRRTQLRNAIAEIGRLPLWVTSVDTNGVARFSRPNIIETSTPGQEADESLHREEMLQSLYDEIMGDQK